MCSSSGGQNCIKQKFCPSSRLITEINLMHIVNLQVLCANTTLDSEVTKLTEFSNVNGHRVQIN